jgi:hypothetical protein
MKNLYSVLKEYRQSKLSYKGFVETTTVKDFPIQANQVYLNITRRRWLNEDNVQVIFALDNY